MGAIALGAPQETQDHWRVFEELEAGALARTLTRADAERLVEAASELFSSPPEGIAMPRLCMAGLEASLQAQNHLYAASFLTLYYAALAGERPSAVFHEALTILRIAVPDSVRVASVDLGLIQGLRGEHHWQEALDALSEWEPRALSPALRNWYAAYLHGERAQVYMGMGLIDLAENHQRRQQGALDKDKHDQRRHADLVEANLLVSQGDLDQLRNRVAEMLLGSGVYDDSPGMAGSLRLRVGLAALSQTLRDPDAADGAQEALREALGSPGLVPEDRVRGLLGLADLALLVGDRAQADRHFAEVEVLGERSSIPRLHRAILATLRGRASLLSGSLTDQRQAHADLESTFDEFLAEWDETNLRAGGVGFLMFHDRRRVLVQLIELTLALEPGDEGREQSLSYLLRAQSRSTLSRTLLGDRVVPSVEDVRRWLCTGDKGLAVYLPHPDRGVLFMVGAQSLEVLVIPRMGLSPNLDLTWRWDYSHPPNDRSRLGGFLTSRKTELGGVAGKILPAEARERIGRWTHVTWVGTDLMGYIPFEDIELASGERLGDRVAMAYLSSMADGVGLAQRLDTRKPSSGRSWSASYPDPDPGLSKVLGTLSPLPLERGDVERILRPYPSVSRVIRHGSKANLAALQESAFRDSNLAQFICHGALDLTRERPATLVLAPSLGHDGIVRCSDVEKLTAPSWIILAACATERGPMRRGDGGSADQVGAFMSAGAAGVIASAVDLHFHPTQRLLVKLHESLADGLSFSEALRQVRIGCDSEQDRVHASLLRPWGLAHVAPFPGGLAGSEGGSGRRWWLLLLLLPVGLMVVALRKRHLRG